MYTRLSFRETSHRVPLRSGAGSAPDRTPHGAGGAAHSRGAILWYRCSRVVPLRLSPYYAACFKAFSFIYLTPRPRRRVSRHHRQPSDRFFRFTVRTGTAAGDRTGATHAALQSASKATVEIHIGESE